MRCMNCMSLIDDSGICKSCSFDNNNSEPEKMRQLMPGTVLKKRFLIGLCKKYNNIFTTYIAYDIDKNIKIYIDEFLPNKLVTRGLGRLKININKESAKTFERAKNLIAGQTKTLIELKSKGLDILGEFEENGTLYIIREFLEDMTLTEFVKKHKEIEIDYARHIAVSLIKIMDPVHKVSIVNGNIKPDNIVIDPIGCVKLTNFGYYGGLSRLLPVPINEGYSPVEQYSRNGEITIKTDIYSIAAVYYYIASGKSPVSAKIRKQTDTLVPLSMLGVPVKKNMDYAILNALNINPKNRTESCRALFNEFKNPDTVRHWERVREKSNRDLSFIKRKSFWIKILVIALIMIMLISIAWLVGETISIRNQAEETNESQISTVAVPKKSE